MANIVYPNVIAFCNNSIRPISESLRAAYYECVSIKIKWDSEIAPEVFSDDLADTIVDGRAGDGVSVLTINDITLTMTQVNAFITMIEQSGVLNIVEKPCVRTLTVN